MTKTASQLREEADRHIDDAAESFDRCDTDGFLSQWASGINAELKRAKADIIDAGGRAWFVGLYDGDRRVRAKLVTVANRFTGGRDSKWLVHEDDPVAKRRQWIPFGQRSRVQKSLGLSERGEMAPARARIHSNGTGLAGCASARVVFDRAGDPYGTDAELIVDTD